MVPNSSFLFVNASDEGKRNHKYMYKAQVHKIYNDPPTNVQ